MASCHMRRSDAPTHPSAAETTVGAAPLGQDSAAPADGVLRLGRRRFGPNELVVMGVVNRTPDSFYDQGATYSLAAAVRRADQFVSEGAVIIDVGGVPAGAGPDVSVSEEARRVLPVIEALRAHHPEVVISVDTYRAEVADQACRSGADLINDAWGGWDPRLREVAAEHGAGLVCTHTGGRLPRTPPRPRHYEDLIGEVIADVTALAEGAVRAGVPADAILVDPAHDFGKTTAQSLALTGQLAQLVATGWPVLVALSRKDFIGETLCLPPSERLEGSLAVTAVAAWLGARVFRTHDIQATLRALRIVAALRAA